MALQPSLRQLPDVCFRTPSHYCSLFFPIHSSKLKHAHAVPTQRHRALPPDYRYPQKSLWALYTPSPPLRWRSPVPSTEVPSDDLGRIAGYRLPARAHARTLQKSVIDVRRPDLGLSTLSRCAPRVDSDTRLKLGPTRPWASKPTAHGTTATFPSLTNYRCGRKKVGRRVVLPSLHSRYMRQPHLFSAYWRAALLMSASVGAYAVRHGVEFRVPRLAAQRTGSPQRALLSSPPFSPPTPLLPPSPQSRFIPLRLSAMRVRRASPHLIYLVICPFLPRSPRAAPP
jgi:hypothetical protein